jgi:hypothetical protein
MPTPTATNIQSEQRTKSAIHLGQSNLPLYSRTVTHSRQYNVLDWITYQIAKHNHKLPTPTCNDANHKPQHTSQWKRKSSLIVESAKLAGFDAQTILTVGKTFQLNPQFVEEMMGFPINHTAPNEWIVHQSTEND